MLMTRDETNLLPFYAMINNFVTINAEQIFETPKLDYPSLEEIFGVSIINGWFIILKLCTFARHDLPM